MPREYIVYNTRTIVIGPSLNERFKRLERQKEKEQSVSVFARLGPPSPPKTRVQHTVRGKKISKKNASSKKHVSKETVADLDRALDDYMKESERAKLAKLDEELSQYVAERKADGSN